MAIEAALVFFFNKAEASVGGARAARSLRPVKDLKPGVSALHPVGSDIYHTGSGLFAFNHNPPHPPHPAADPLLASTSQPVSSSQGRSEL